MSYALRLPDPIGVVRARDEHAWDAYAQACHNPLATDEERGALFQTAMVSLTAVLSAEVTEVAQAAA